MFCRACESPAVVHDIENGQPIQSAMKRLHSGGTGHVIMVSPVPVCLIMVAILGTLVECVQTKYASS